MNNINKDKCKGINITKGAPSMDILINSVVDKRTNNKPSKNYTMFFVFLFIFTILNTYLVMSLYKKAEIKKELFRLHVFANSNNLEDQLVKLKVSSTLENYLKEQGIFESEDSNEIKEALIENKDEILNLCNNVLKNNNVDYSSTLNIGRQNYEEKDSILVSMEPGIYNSLNITLGNR